jgi:hypothetical protein
VYGVHSTTEYPRTPKQGVAGSADAQR